MIITDRISKYAFMIKFIRPEQFVVFIIMKNVLVFIFLSEISERFV
jgi:hypothetical protein